MKNVLMGIAIIILLFCILTEVNALRRAIAPDAETVDEKFIVFLEDKLTGDDK